MKLSEELQVRGFVNQVSGEDLPIIFDGEKRVVYHGIDPTADSAHAGNFVIWMMLKHLVNHGHKVIFLVGGGTGMIGDPKPDAERVLSSREEVGQRVEKIKIQAENFFGADNITFVDNYDWLSQLSLIDFLRDIGKHFTVNELVKKEAIAKRLESEVGLSYTEFAYPLLQAYDYLKLYKDKNCTLQVGGSDQWGNIVAGVDLIRRVEKVAAYAVTVPLIIDKTTGKKFGKSEGNAVWLAAEKTSPYAFYQFWLNVPDENVIDYLKLFTFLSLEEISVLAKELESNPGARMAQKSLARETTTLVHGAKAAEAANNVSSLLFGDHELSKLNKEELEILSNNAPTIDIVEGSALIDVLVNSGLATSKRESRTFIESGAVTLNGQRMEDIEMKLGGKNFESGIALLRRGKKNYCVLRLV